MDVEATYDAFIHGRLSRSEWTHEAHLAACWVTLRDRSPREALGFLRDSIKTHNCGVGTVNSEASGYHESLTVYYVTAVHRAAAPTFEALLDVDYCGRTAPLEHWSEAVLFSPEARLGWLAPNLTELPWPVTETLDEYSLATRV